MKALRSSKNIIDSVNVDNTRDVFVLKVTTNTKLPLILRKKTALVCDSISSVDLPSGFEMIFSKKLEDASVSGVEYLAPELSYLTDGDIIRVQPSINSLRAIYRVDSNANFLFITEQCNSFCLMCSQPPRAVNDEHLVEELLEAVPMINKGAHEIGITGGEPTLLGEKFFSLVQSLKVNLPSTAVHVLSNGRTFSDENLAYKLSEINHHDIMVGIPLYSDLPHIHDYVVQSDGAFDETIRGILQLKRHVQKVEIRVVIHKLTYERLPQLAQFIVRNLQFADHVALMGLEITGFTRANLDELWVDPVDYQDQLTEAVRILQKGSVKVSIYNLQKCLLPRELWSVSVKSISDWKNKFYDECDSCLAKSDCGGFFSSSDIKRSEFIKPITE